MIKKILQKGVIKLKLAIVDDEPRWIEMAKQQVVKYWEKEAEIYTYTDGESFLEAMEKFDLILMDIEMPEMDGFDTIKKYRKRNKDGLFLILTTHMEMSTKGYQVEAFRYIDKLKMQEELEEAFDSAKLRFKQDRRVSIPIKHEGEKEIPIKKIIYFEAQLRNIILHTDQGDYACTKSLSKLKEQLEEYGFFMPHKPYLVNFEWVESFNDTEVIMKNGDKLMMSRRRYRECKNKHFDWKFSIANR